MLELKNWLSKLSHKTWFITTAMGILTFYEGAATLLSSGAIRIIDFVGGAILLIAKAIAPTGTLPSGWTTILWITNILAILVQLGGFFSGSGMFSDAAVLVITKIQILLNAAIAGIQIATTKTALK